MTVSSRKLVRGSVVIILEGEYSGKRVVCVHVLNAKEAVVIGPSTINGVNLTKIRRDRLIVTKQTVSLKDVSLSKETISFLQNPPKTVEEKVDMLEKKKTEVQIPEHVKEDQNRIENCLSTEIKKTNLLTEYLQEPFSLKKGEIPHLMVF